MTIKELEAIIAPVDAAQFAEFFQKGIALQQQGTLRAKARLARAEAQKAVQTAEQTAQELEAQAAAIEDAINK
jgi:hypothetical protein